MTDLTAARELEAWLRNDGLENVNGQWIRSRVSMQKYLAALSALIAECETAKGGLAEAVKVMELCNEALQMDESDCAYAPGAGDTLDRIADFIERHKVNG